MNPPPPMFPASGCTTASANPTATAASTALPPCRRMSRPMALASGWPDTTIAAGASVTIALLLCGQVREMPEAGSGASVPRPAHAAARVSTSGNAAVRRRRTDTSTTEKERKAGSCPGGSTRSNLAPG